MSRPVNIRVRFDQAMHKFEVPIGQCRTLNRVPDRLELVTKFASGELICFDVDKIGQILIRVLSVSRLQSFPDQDTWDCYGVVANDDPEKRGEITFKAMVNFRSGGGSIYFGMRQQKSEEQPE
jgi:hypothetical protein